jgi:hypothetical protein
MFHKLKSHFLTEANKDEARGLTLGRTYSPRVGGVGQPWPGRVFIDAAVQYAVEAAMRIRRRLRLYHGQ